VTEEELETTEGEEVDVLAAHLELEGSKLKYKSYSRPSPLHLLSEVAYNDTRGHGQFKATRPERNEKRKEWIYCLKLSLVNSFF
jgi:hypothetical protein